MDSENNLTNNATPSAQPSPFMVLVLLANGVVASSFIVFGFVVAFLPEAGFTDLIPAYLWFACMIGGAALTIRVVLDWSAGQTGMCHVPAVVLNLIILALGTSIWLQESSCGQSRVPPGQALICLDMGLLNTGTLFMRKWLRRELKE